MIDVAPQFARQHQSVRRLDAFEVHDGTIAPITIGHCTCRPFRAARLGCSAFTRIGGSAADVTVVAGLLDPAPEPIDW